MRSIRDQLIAKSQDFYLQQGYSPVEPLSLHSHDPSLSFTNSSIVKFKPYITGEEVLGNARFFLMQPCFKTHNLKYYEQTGPDEELTTLSYFSQISTFEGGAISAHVIETAREWLYSILACDIQRLAFICPQDQQNSALLINKIFGTKRVRYGSPIMTHWTYGIEHVVGTGILIYAELPRSSRRNFTLIGDIVEARNQATGEVYTEICIGIEHFLRLMQPDTSVIDTSQIGWVRKNVQLPHTLNVDIFLDALMAAFELSRLEPEVIRARKYKYVFHKYMKFVIAYNENFLSDDNFVDLAWHYYHINYPGTMSVEKSRYIINFQQTYNSQSHWFKKNTQRFRSFLEQNSHLPRADIQALGVKKFGMLKKQLDDYTAH